ncbi:hypothetical protein [Methanococcoides sp. AM1]|uniref:hypothetical protein n=1 Tax=Methanococcoides sp. AM1 TaxID=1201011 RepID=UPI0010835247|nr:hypothetical protein [Methanococcoides sp. AM1]
MIQNIKQFMKRHWCLNFVILINIITHWVWVFNDGFITHGDAGVWLLDTQKELLFNSFLIYNNNVGLGNVLLTASYYPIQFLYGILANIGIGYNFALRMLLLWPYLIVTPIVAYFLSLKILKSRPAAAISAIIVLFNTYTLTLQTGHLFVLIADSLLLIFFYYAYSFFVEGYERNDFLRLLICGVILSAYEFRIFYISVWIINLFLIYRFINKHEYQNFLYWILSLSIIGLLNLPWILPLTATNSLISNEIFSRGLFGNEFFDINSAIALFHRFWTGESISVFIVQPIPIYFYLIPILAFMGLLLNRKNQNVLFFAIMALIGILLTKQVGEPFPDLYPWLYNNMPGFNAFREASKFYFVIVFGYSILIGSFVAWLWTKWSEKKWQTYGKSFITICIALLFVWNANPLITGEFGATFVAREIPKDYPVANEFIQKQPDFFRTLWVPTDSRWSTYTSTHPKVSNIQTLQSSWDKILKNDGQVSASDSIENQTMNILKQPYSDKLLDTSSIKYVILPIQDINNDDDFFIHYGKRTYYLNELEQIDYLKKIDIGTKDIVVYENKDYRPHIYYTSENETIYKQIPFQDIEFQMKNPTQYEIQLKNISEPIYLHFSDRYHPDWKLKVGEFNWFIALMDKNYFISDEVHFENDALLNSFLIDPKYIQDEFSEDNYIRNNDGSINLDLTLYFRPQSYFYVGSIVSGLTVLGILVYLTMGWLKKTSTWLRR